MVNLNLYAQSPDLQARELQLQQLFIHQSDDSDDIRKKEVSDSIDNIMGETLALPGSFDYSFSQLTRMGKIYSPDGFLRIYTWNVPWLDGTSTFYGYIQYRPEKRGPVQVIRLDDQHESIEQPEDKILSPDQWFGMLIYEIVDEKVDNQVYYTLLGYQNKDLFISRKIVDVFYFNAMGQPLFGKPLFVLHQKLQSRVIFNYSAQVQMSLKWNNRLKMIVFDHLSPSKPSYTGNYQYYGPDFSFDGLRFEQKQWKLVEDLDVRNSSE